MSWLQLIVVLLLSVIVQVSFGGVSETLIGIQGRDFILLASDGSIGRGGAVLTTTRQDKIRSFPNGIAVAAMGDTADVEYLLRTLRAKQLEQKGAGSSPQLQHDVYDCSTGKGPLSTLEKRPKGADWTVECVAEALRFEIYRTLRSQNPMKETAFLIAGFLPQDTTTATAMADISNVKDEIRAASKNFQPNDATIQDEELSMTDVSQEKRTTQPTLFWLDPYGSLQKVAYGAHGHASSLLWSVLDRGWHKNMNLAQAQRLLEDCMECLKGRFLFNPSTDAFIVKCIDENGCRRLT